MGVTHNHIRSKSNNPTSPFCNMSHTLRCMWASQVRRGKTGSGQESLVLSSGSFNPVFNVHHILVKLGLS